MMVLILLAGTLVAGTPLDDFARSERVSFVTVEKTAGGDVVFCVRETIRGEPLAATIRLPVAGPWARPGCRAVLFQYDGISIVGWGIGWHLVKDGKAEESGDWPDMFAGSAGQMERLVRDILAGKAASIPAAETDGRKRDWLRGRTAALFRVKGGKDDDFNALGFRTQGLREPVAPLVRQLAHPDPIDRAWAASRLGLTEGKAALRHLRRAMRDKEAHVRLYAADAVLRMDKEADALTVYRAALRSPLRKAAIQAAGDLGPRGQALLPDLLPLLDDKEAKLDAIWSLGRIGDGDKAALDAVVEVTRDMSYEGQGCHALVELRSRLALPLLLRRLRGDAPLSVARLLRKLDPEEALKAGAW